jgi:tetratricopeptide (TPR) repeat protein
MEFTQLWIFDSLLIFYSIHSVISLFIAYISSLFLLKRFDDKKHLFIGFIFLLNLAIPIVGYLFSIWIVYYLLNVKYTKLLNNVSYINMVEFETEFPEIKRIFGEGSMSDLLNNSFAPTSLKMKALVAMADNITQKNISLIKNSLSDKDDEIRLYSFAIIDKMERGINKNIHIKLSEFQETDDEDRRVELAEELTYLYWDMVYYELSDEDLKQYILQEVQKYAQIVLNRHMDHININVLLGKVYLMQHKYHEAATCFTIAIEQDTDAGYTQPYLAEIFYNQRNFRTTKSLLNSAKTLQMNSTLYPIIQQWKSA